MAINQRGKDTWLIQVYTGKLRDGKRDRHYETFKGKKKDAQAREAELKAKLKRGTFIEKHEFTFESFSKKWMQEYAKPTLSPKTNEGNEFLLRRVNKEIGHIKLKNLKPLHLIEFYNKLRNTDKLGQPGTKISENTVLHYYTIIGGILNRAVKWQIIENNPNKNVDRPKPKKVIAKAYNIEQVNRLINAISGEKLKYRAIILLAIDSGARRGEIMGLEWNDIDFINNRITINKSIQCIKGEIIEKPPKNDNSIRKVIITQKTIDILKEYKKEQDELRKTLGTKWMGSKKVFTSNDGYYMHPDTPRKEFEKILLKHKLPLITFHQLRHTCASLLINMDTSIFAVGKRLGHKSIQTTIDIYSHISEKKEKECANKLNNIFTQ